MALLPILSVPDPRLRQKAQPVKHVDDDIRRLMDDMVETMLFENRGVGLAANQVGVLKRVIVCHFGEPINSHPLKMANPEVVFRSSALFTLKEGCLSVPQQWSDVSRPEIIRVRYVDDHNQTQEIEVKDELSSAIQHEIDHLDGVLFIDHLSATRKHLLLERALKIKKRSVL
jgi:peptide deformylase